ncbi:MAG TPA: methionine biosynthesis protein MetW [Thermodesulfobacteriota bacterium]|nr:methionine biosynthesis protein MetW [Thermodesulfobacteriota bacterium]
MQSETLPLEYKAILEWVKWGASVLDLGCGDGELLALLVRERSAKAQGIEIDERAIYECVAKGLSVFHEDIDNGLSDYADHSFDYVILNQSFQQVKKPDIVLQEALRVGKEVIIGFPNFAHYRGRLQIFFKGKTPVTPSLPYEWHDTPNLHFLSISDFVGYCHQRKIKIDKEVFIGDKRRVKVFPNLFALIGVFLVSPSKAGG